MRPACRICSPPRRPAGRSSHRLHRIAQRQRRPLPDLPSLNLRLPRQFRPVPNRPRRRRRSAYRRSAPPPAGDYPAAADRRMAAAATLPPRVPDRPSISPDGNNLLRALAVARATAAAEQTVAASAAAKPHDATSVAKPAQASSPKPESGGLLWHWLAAVNENLTVSWKLAPVVVALGWCAWQARTLRKRPDAAESQLPLVDNAPLRCVLARNR